MATANGTAAKSKCNIRTDDFYVLNQIKPNKKNGSNEERTLSEKHIFPHGTLFFFTIQPGVGVRRAY